MIRTLIAGALLLALPGAGLAANTCTYIGNTCVPNAVLVDPTTGLPYVAGGSGGSSLPTAVSVTITETGSITGGATGASVLAANTSRKYLSITNDGTGNCRIAFGATTPTASLGIPLGAATASGGQGGSFTMEASAISTQAVSAYCAATSTLTIAEGQ